MNKANKRSKQFQPPVLVLALVRHLFGARIWTFTLACLTILSAFVLVVLNHEQRQSYAVLEQLNNERDDLDVEWRQLRLEQRFLAEHSRLEKVAIEELGMKTLDLKSERIVKQVKDSE